MKASQLAKIEALKMRAEADKAYCADRNLTSALYGDLSKRAEEMAVLALEFEQDERNEAYSQGYLAAMERGV